MTQATNPLSQSFFAKQVTNKNYLSPVGFKFVITKAPKADFFSNQASIPGRHMLYMLWEKNTETIAGFIRLGSPVMSIKPRTVSYTHLTLPTKA